MILNWQGNDGPIKSDSGGQPLTSHGPALVAAGTLLDMIYVGKSGPALWNNATLAAIFPKWDWNTPIDACATAPCAWPTRARRATTCGSRTDSHDGRFGLDLDPAPCVLRRPTSNDAGRIARSGVAFPPELPRNIDMRSIAGQIQGYRFPDITPGNNAEAVFMTAMQAQIGGGAVVEAQNFAGNEHLGITFGSVQPFPDLAQDVAVPAGFAMALEYALDEIVGYLNGVWILLTSQDRRARLDNLDAFYVPYGIEPDAKGNIELGSLTLTCAGTTVTTTLAGTYVVGHALPDVPFSVSFSETLEAFPTVPQSANLSAQIAPAVLDADTTRLVLALDALAATGASLAGIFGIGLYGYGAEAIADYLREQLQPIAGALGLLRTVVGNMPQRIDLPGTTDELVFHYDSVTLPQGTLASSGNTLGVEASQPGAAIVFLGKAPPVRTPRTVDVEIVGPASVKLLATAGPQPVSAHQPQQVSYRATVNDEAQSPTFRWSLTSPSGTAACIFRPDQRGRV